MAAPAKAAVHDLLRHALSEAGYQKATDIMALEEPLGLIENQQGHYRHPENYSVTVFGEPGRLPWGWRIEGHHLSLNFTAVSEALIAVTPTFFGSNPAKVPAGYPMAGHRTLARETDLSFELIRSLDEAQRAPGDDRRGLARQHRDHPRPRGLAAHPPGPAARRDARAPAQPRARAGRRLHPQPAPRPRRRRARAHQGRRRGRTSTSPGAAPSSPVRPTIGACTGRSA